MNLLSKRSTGNGAVQVVESKRADVGLMEGASGGHALLKRGECLQVYCHKRMQQAGCRRGPLVVLSLRQGVVRKQAWLLCMQASTSGQAACKSMTVGPKLAARACMSWHMAFVGTCKRSGVSAGRLLEGTPGGLDLRRSLGAVVYSGWCCRQRLSRAVISGNANSYLTQAFWKSVFD